MKSIQRRDRRCGKQGPGNNFLNQLQWLRAKALSRGSSYIHSFLRRLASHQTANETFAPFICNVGRLTVSQCRSIAFKRQIRPKQVYIIKTSTTMMKTTTTRSLWISCQLVRQSFHRPIVYLLLHIPLACSYRRRARRD